MCEFWGAHTSSPLHPFTGDQAPGGPSLGGEKPATFLAGKRLGRPWWSQALPPRHPQASPLVTVTSS